MSAPFALRTMGAFALTNAVTGENLLPPRRKARGLLAYLALSTQGAATRERLSGLLWPDRASEQARASLRQSIADLNRLVGGEPRLIKPTREEVSVDRDLLTVDKDRFIQAARSGDLVAIERGLADWNGRILEDLGGLGEAFDEWLVNLRRVAELEIFNAALSAAEADLGKAPPQTLALIAARLTAVDPFNEGAARLSLCASAAGGDLAAVHRLYREFETLLRDELHTAPAIETRQLYLDLVGKNVAREPQAVVAARALAPVAASRAEATRPPAPAPVFQRLRWPVALVALAALVAAGAGVLSAGSKDRSAPSPETLAMYQSARDAANQRTRLGVYRAVSLFQQVVRRSPNFSRGWSGLAFADYLASSNPKAAGDLDIKDADWAGRTQSAADRALALDPKNGEAYMVLATAAQDRNDLATMNALIDRGLAADPTEPSLFRLKASSLLGLGYARAALPYARRAVLLDPLDPRATSMLYDTLLEIGAAAEARSVLADAYARFPLYPHIWLERLLSLIDQRRFGEAEAMVLPTALTPDRTFAGTPAQLRLMIQTLETGRPHLVDAAIKVPGDEGKENEAQYYLWRLALLGRLDEAFALVKGLQVRPVTPGRDDGALRGSAGFNLASFIDPSFDRFRRDPRFMNLWVLDGTALVWQESGRWPDFCQRPGWPYDCKAVAARYTAEDSRFSSPG